MTIKRIIEVTKNYSIRHFFKNKNYTKPFIYDLSDKSLCQITSNTNDEDINGILFCDFNETKNIAYLDVKSLINNPELLITDHNIPVKNFKYWYGLYNNKLFINTLSKLPDDMIVMPVRNLKANINKPFDKIITKNGLLYLSNDENNVILPYEQKGNNIGKCVLISEEGHSLFIYGVNYNTKKEIDDINLFLSKYPSYPVLVDNGRYLFYFIGKNTTKESFLCGGFADIDDMFVIGFT